MSGIAMMLIGGGSVDLALTSRTLTDTATTGTAAVVMFLNNDGTFDYTRNVLADGSIAGQWTTTPIAPSVAALYEVVVTLTSGTFSTGSGVGTFNLGTGRSWGVSAAAGTNKVTSADFTIRRVSGGGQVVVAGITLSAQAA